MEQMFVGVNIRRFDPNPGLLISGNEYMTRQLDPYICPLVIG